MENKGENGANWSSDSSQEDNLSDDLFINGANSNHHIDQNGVEDDSMEAPPALSRNMGVGPHHNLIGLDQPEIDADQNDDVSQSDDYEDEGGEEEIGDEEEEEEFEYEGFGSSLVENPQISTNSPGSVSSTNVRADIYRASDLLMAVSLGSDPNKGRIIQQAIDSMAELITMATKGEPLWQRRGNGEMEILNGLQYLREFGTFDATMEAIIRMVENGEPQCFTRIEFPSGSRNMPATLAFEPLHIEASRDVGLVNATAINIVGFLMDTNQWGIAFFNIVARATLLGVLSHGVLGSHDGLLQVMTAEFHQSTPLIPARQSYFARYCNQVADRTWAVVDVSLESLFPYPQVQFRRRPSGCLIQEMPNGVSRVTWVEHVEVDNRLVHPIFQPIVSSGFAFGAKRWIAVLNRHCHWIATLMDRTTPQDHGALFPLPGRDSLLQLAWRMTRDFFMNVSSSTENAWMQLPTPITSNEDIRFRFGNHLILPEKPPSSTLVFTTSLRLPTPPKTLFDFLRDHRSRTKWDLLSHERSVRELSHVRTGERTENRVSILQVKSSNKIEIMYLQESFTDETGAFVVYAPLDASAMTMIINGGNPESTTILPSGFAILPDKPPGQGEEPVGSILTIAFKTADYNFSSLDYIPTAVLETIDGVLTTTVSSIKDAIFPNHGSQ